MLVAANESSDQKEGVEADEAALPEREAIESHNSDDLRMSPSNAELASEERKADVPAPDVRQPQLFEELQNVDLNEIMPNDTLALGTPANNPSSNLGLAHKEDASQFASDTLFKKHENLGKVPTQKLPAEHVLDGKNVPPSVLKKSSPPVETHIVDHKKTNKLKKFFKSLAFWRKRHKHD